jgi:hypothetical protein
MKFHVAKIFLVKEKGKAALLVLLFAILWVLVNPTAAIFLTLFLGWLVFSISTQLIAQVALVVLVLIPFALGFGEEAIAEQLAVYVYFFLVIFVVLEMIFLARKPSRKKAASHAAIRISSTFKKASRRLGRFLANISMKLKIIDQPKVFTGLVFLSVAVLVLWNMLLPGYILTLDMIFAPELRASFSEVGFNNFLPVAYLLEAANFFLPSWLIQKGILVLLFVALGFFSFAYLPVPNERWTRLFAAFVYIFNPFVYARFLAGHWTHLLAFSLLPLFLNLLLKLKHNPNKRNSLKLFGSLALLGIFSVHIFTMAALVLCGFAGVTIVKAVYQKQYAFAHKFLESSLLGAVFLLMATSYWTFPAFFREVPLERGFGLEHWQVFAATGYEGIGVFLNLLTLGGFWGQGMPWAQSFLWPQDFLLFWFAIGVLAIVVVIGTWAALREKTTRLNLLFLLGIGFLSLIFAAGVNTTIFQVLNLWLYEHVFFWGGFRDSQKFTAFLALFYATASGHGFSRIVNFVDQKALRWKDVVISLLFLVPMIGLGFLFWWGFHGQLNPVFYPESWWQAKAIVEADNKAGKVLILPWHGYMSFPFADNRLIANPGDEFFGKYAIQSQNVELGGIYDQGGSGSYKDIDRVMRRTSPLEAGSILELLRESRVSYIVFFQNLQGSDNFTYPFLYEPGIYPVLKAKDVRLYKIK